MSGRRHVDHVQITVAESIGVEGRGAFYEETGALRDILQNHLLQLLTLVAMEPPAKMDAYSIRNETLKVFQSIRRFKTAGDIKENVVTGQYQEGCVQGTVKGAYRNEQGVAANSATETYAAIRFFIDNWWLDKENGYFGLYFVKFRRSSFRFAK